MTTWTFIVLIAASMLGMIICAVKSYKFNNPIAGTVRVLLYSSMVPVFANALISVSGIPVASGNEALGTILAHIGFLFYLAGTNLMFYVFFVFCMEYCDYNYKHTLLHRAVAMLIALDTVSVFLNILLEHVYDIVLIYDPVLSEYHYVLHSKGFHYLHLIVSSLIALLCLSILLRKTFTTSKLYNVKYWLIIASIIPVAFWEFYYIFSSSPIDASMVGYSLCTILIYYFSLEYRSHKLNDRILSQITKSLSDGIILFNEKKDCTYANDRSFELMGIVNTPENLKAVGKSATDCLGPEAVSAADGKFYERLLYINDIECFYRISCNKLFDPSGVGLGSYITIHDRTVAEAESKRRIYQAKHDSLTGLYTSDFFQSLVRKRLDDYPDKDYYIVVGDIDEFKLINDVFGRKTGDDVLKKVAHIIDINCTRSLYCRLNADRFAILIPRELFDRHTFERMSRIEQPAAMGTEHHPITLRIGVYDITERSLPVSVMIDRAFMAIQSIKGDLVTRLAFYDDSMRSETLRSQRICASVDEAINRNDILPYLQPQVDMDGNMTGAEVLVRWNHVTEGFLYPYQFIPILEEQGLVSKVDRFMWDSACRIIAKWNKEGNYHTYLSVNISPKDFYFMNVHEELLSLTKKYDIPHDLLRLEITETLFMDETKDTFKIMDDLRKEGFIVEMDDFGSGYSSLNMLKDMPIDVLKLDMIFLRESETSDKSLSIVKSIVNMAHELGLSVVNEGVETEYQFNYLKGIGTETYQGYYFDRPMTLKDFEKKYMPEI